MDLKELRTFAAVADTGTVGGAAKRMHCVQSNVTSRIKSLEEELGVTLFNRSRAGMSLTSAGVVFLPHARAVLQAESQARASVDAFGGTVKFLRVGSMESTLAVRLPKLLSEFRRANPELRLQIISGPTESLIEKLVGDQIDIAFVGGKFPHPNLKGHPLFAEEMVMISARDAVSPESLRSYPIVVFKQGCSYRDFTRKWVRTAGLAPNETFEVGTLDGILGCVASGVGISCLPRSVVDASPLKDLLLIHQLDDPERFIDTYAMCNPSSVRNGAVDAFLAIARQTRFEN